MNKTIYNPFEKFSETQLLILGIALTIGGSLLGYLFNITFDGVLDVHPYENITPARPFIDNLINTLSLSVPLFILGFIINTKTRFIDVLNTALIARSPSYLLAFGNANDFFTNLDTKINPANPMDVNFAPLDIFILGVFTIFSIASLIWFVALLYNGFKTATNLKQTSHKVAFGFVIILAEILSKITIDLLNY